MKRLIAFVLAFATLINCPIMGSAIMRVNKSNSSPDYCKVETEMFDKVKVSENNEIVVLGVVKVSLDVNNAPDNIELNLKTKEEPMHYNFNIFKRKFLRKVPVREEVNKFQLDGVPVKKFWLKLFGKKNVPVDVYIVPLSDEDAEVFKDKPVEAGDYKPKTKADKELLEKIKEKHGEDEKAFLYKTLFEKAISGIKYGNLDDYDPFNVVESGTLSNIEEAERRHDNYLLSPDYCYSFEEAKKVNKQIEAKRLKVYNKLTKRGQEDFIKCGDLGKISTGKSAKSFLIVTKGKEAWKLRSLMADYGNRFLRDDQSKIEITFEQQKFIFPPNISKEEYDEVMKQINYTREGKSFLRYVKDAFKICCPQFISDIFRSLGLTIGKLFGGDSKNSSKAPSSTSTSTGGVKSVDKSKEEERADKLADIRLEQEEAKLERAKIDNERARSEIEQEEVKLEQAKIENERARFEFDKLKNNNNLQEIIIKKPVHKKLIKE